MCESVLLLFLVSRATRWRHESASLSGVLRCSVTSVGKRESLSERKRGTWGAATQPLVLRILCRLSILDAAVILILFLFFLLFADQELLWRPAELPALDFSLRRLDHDGRQPIFELTATVKVRGVGEYLERRHKGKILIINLLLLRKS